MGVFRFLGGPPKAAVVISQECGKEGISRLPTGDAGQAHEFDQTILQDPIGPFHPPLGLWRVGTDAFDPQLAQRPPELGQRRRRRLGGIDPEYAVPVAVKRLRQAVPADVLLYQRHVVSRRFRRHEAGRLNAAGGVIHKNQQRAARRPAFEPVVGRAVDLYQLPQPGPSCSRRMEADRPALGPPQPGLAHQRAGRLHRENQTVALKQHLSGKGRSEIPVLFPDHGHRRFPTFLVDPVIGLLASPG